MLFRQLEYFVAVARERHFARAAEACYVSQPALSASIAKLERELNVTLINRGQNFEGLTPVGERLVVWARRILAEQDAFKAEGPLPAPLRCLRQVRRSYRPAPELVRAARECASCPKPKVSRARRPYWGAQSPRRSAR